MEASDHDSLARALSAVRPNGRRTGFMEADADMECAVDPEGPRWIRATAISVSLFLPAAAAVALMFYEPRSTEEGATAVRLVPVGVPTVTPIVRARTADCGAPLFRDGYPLPLDADLVEGDRVASGARPGCLRIDPGVEARLAADSEIRIEALSTAGPALELLRGQTLVRFESKAPQ